MSDWSHAQREAGRQDGDANRHHQQDRQQAKPGALDAHVHVVAHGARSMRVAKSSKWRMGFR